ncbi:MAG: thiol peroxidase [Candidatus Marinimicrobia bacterium]|jgi:thioredoxin-dependent peroxiredoxin|nr:thiol peroxidase [Candidatus Neomarinimicrobiota bacterium]MBT7669401.1 thiol peroxidase [Bdellovibrionales bacterium]MBT4361792.1 thiol peroxidase [Candidatus Neomarinimicrobiota bacterium]MBT4714452.1 thiol peroxidase [Candidatus Neomarinimicrobiota bacterium]MBT4946153.1 thiol peroxidase [Candidatus Neomarinimicrobiota bacterium]
MATISLRGNPVNTVGELPAVGSIAKDFELVGKDLSRVSMAKFKGSRLVLNIFPSLDTGTCAASVRYFNELAGKLPDTKVLCISRDTPFAQSRFCGAEGLENVITLSDFESGQFGKDYGLQVIDSVMKGFLSRVVIIVDTDGKVTYTQQVPVISDEPNYDEVVAALG